MRFSYNARTYCLAIVVMLLGFSGLAVAGPETTRAVAVINNTFGINVPGPALVEIADAFVKYRSDFVPVDVVVNEDGTETFNRRDPATLTNDEKAAIFLKAVQVFIKNTTVATRERLAAEAAQPAVETSKDSARAAAEALFQ